MESSWVSGALLLQRLGMAPQISTIRKVMALLRGPKTLWEALWLLEHKAVADWLREG